LTWYGLVALATYRFSITWELNFTRGARMTWTAPANLRCGDLILLYEAKSGGGRGAFVAIGRAATDAVRAYNGDGHHWAWIDWRVVTNPLALPEARAITPFPSLQGSAAMPSSAFAKVARRLVKGDAPATAALARWGEGKGFPRTDEVPLRDLVLSSLHASGGPQEIALYPKIRNWFANDRWVEWTDKDGVSLRGLRGPVVYDPDGNEHRLQPDLVLRRPRSQRILVIEVKLVALPKQGYRNPVDQVLDYAKAIRRLFDRSDLNRRSITPLLVAEEFSPVVLEEARSARTSPGIAAIKCRKWTAGRCGPDLI
jgi:hypothetical protein